VGSHKEGMGSEKTKSKAKRKEWEVKDNNNKVTCGVQLQSEENIYNRGSLESSP
jgi:hypothetical protein